jgi:hypothetical protein
VRTPEDRSIRVTAHMPVEINLQPRQIIRELKRRMEAVGGIYPQRLPNQSADPLGDVGQESMPIWKLTGQNPEPKFLGASHIVSLIAEQRVPVYYPVEQKATLVDVRLN